MKKYISISLLIIFQSLLFNNQIISQASCHVEYPTNAHTKLTVRLGLLWTQS